MGFSIGILFLSIISIITSFDEIGYYRVYYKKLDKEKFFNISNQLICNMKGGSNSISYLVDRKSILLANKAGLFNSFLLTYVNPINVYWYIKYRKWFNKGIKENRFEKI